MKMNRTDYKKTEQVRINPYRTICTVLINDLFRENVSRRV